MATDTKVEAQVYFTAPDGVMPATREYPAVVHLFEHQYDERITFWYGVADVVGIPRDSIIRLESLMVFFFPDGLSGRARQLESYYESGAEGEYVKIAFVGIDYRSK